MVRRWRWRGDPAAIALRSVGTDPNATFRDVPGVLWPPNEVTRRIRATENQATAIPGRYSDELLGPIDPMTLDEVPVDIDPEPGSFRECRHRSFDLQRVADDRELVIGRAQAVAGIPI